MLYQAKIEVNLKPRHSDLARAEEMCRRLLANPTKDDDRFELEEIE